jgi:hypothetical protein
MKFSAKEWLALGAMLALTACATIRPPLPPSLELPKPPLDLHATRKGDKVLLTWSVPTVTTDRQTIRSFGATRICRSKEAAFAQCGTAVAEVPPAGASSQSSSQPSFRPSAKKVPATFTDALPAELGRDPLDSVLYAVEVLNAGGRGAGLSNRVRVPLAATLPPPRDFVTWLTDDGVTLTWKEDAAPATQGVHYIYRVYRRMEGSQANVLAGEIPAGSETQYKLNDDGIEWEKTYYYHAEAMTVIAREGQAEERIEGEDTAETKVFADDVFPPAVPSGLQAVFSGPGQAAFIDLIWAPVPNIDLAGYNVYRHEAGAAPVKLNVELVKAPAFRDAKVSAGKSYSYSVSAVDQRGNESGRSDEASESVP